MVGRCEIGNEGTCAKGLYSNLVEHDLRLKSFGFFREFSPDFTSRDQRRWCQQYNRGPNLCLMWRYRVGPQRTRKWSVHHNCWTPQTLGNGEHIRTIGSVSLEITLELVASCPQFLTSNMVFSKILFFKMYLYHILYYFPTQALIYSFIQQKPVE